ncbi:hypothetical protein BS78_03G171400 [Paspalum vaginatum]|nr:hypothetical protein BS78_03G171400 [Paspalum vaginatum]
MAKYLCPVQCNGRMEKPELELEPEKATLQQQLHPSGSALWERGRRGENRLRELSAPVKALSTALALQPNGAERRRALHLCFPCTLSD